MGMTMNRKNPVLLMALAACYPVLGYAAGGAHIDFAIGNVTAVSTAGGSRPLAKGARLVSGETVRTGPDGRVQLRFDDGAMVSLQPRSEFRLDNYNYNGKPDGEERGFFSLLKGGLRTLSGLIGRANHDHYKVTTAVATIGIRGTEYTISYIDPETISVGTGEGAVEVCNGAGCVLLSSGDSAIVSGTNAPARSLGFTPRLPPAQPGDTVLATYSSSANLNANGTLAGQGMPSGAGYTLAYGGYDATNSSSLTPGTRTGMNAQFDAANNLLSASNATTTASATALLGGFSADGVIGWGRWSTGTASGVSGSSSVIDVKDFHYVIGQTTAAGDLAALAGITATYNMIGYTTPTATNGTVGGAPTGTLTASFGATLMTVSLNMNVPFAGTNYSISGGTTSASLSSTFAFNTACASVAGFFAGTNASHAGITYSLDTGSTTLTGAAAFKK